MSNTAANAKPGSGALSDYVQGEACFTVNSESEDLQP